MKRMNELTQPEETEKLVTVLRKEVKNERYITLFLEIKIYVQVISSCCVSRFLFSVATDYLVAVKTAPFELFIPQLRQLSGVAGSYGAEVQKDGHKLERQKRFLRLRTIINRSIISR